MGFPEQARRPERIPSRATLRLPIFASFAVVWRVLGKGASMKRSDGDEVLQSLRNIIRQNMNDAPSEPGVYLMPCGACVVDFFLTLDGQERWLVAGDDASYTRATVAIARHGDAGWRRLWTLEDAAAELISRATESGAELGAFVRTV